VVSYFRWRQAPFGQEQMHTGLHRPDRTIDQGGVEAKQVANELEQLLRAAQDTKKAQSGWKITAKIALVFDYPSVWMAQIQPQGQDFHPVQLMFEYYSALRQLGFDIDIVPSRASFDRYAMVVLPCHLRDDTGVVDKVLASGAQVVLGPRSGSKSDALTIPATLPPGAWGEAAGIRVVRVESLPVGLQDVVHGAELAATGYLYRWREHLSIDSQTQVVLQCSDGSPVMTRRGRVWYHAACFDTVTLLQSLSWVALSAGLEPQSLPKDVRINAAGEVWIVQNFSSTHITWKPPQAQRCLLGSIQIPAQGLAIWQQ
jgi:beta-galactosidase